MPTAVTVNGPVPNTDAPKSIAFTSVIETTIPLEFSVTAPVKSLLALARIITPSPELKVTKPAEDA